MIGIMSIAIVLSLSLGSAWALAPLIVIVILIAAAAGLTRGGDFFSIMGLGTLLGLSRGIGGGGAGKGLKSGSAMQRRSMKAMVKKRTPKGLKALAKKAGAKRATRRLEKKQVKLIGRAGAALNAGKTARAEKLLQKAARVGGKAQTLGGGSKYKSGLVNQAVKLQNRGAIRRTLTRTPNQANMQVGFNYLASKGGTLTSQASANMSTKLATANARGRAGGVVGTLGSMVSGVQLNRAIQQHNNMKNLVSNAGAYNPPTKPALASQKLSAWASARSSAVKTLMPYVPGLAVVVGVSAAISATRAGLSPVLTKAGATKAAGEARAAVSAETQVPVAQANALGAHINTKKSREDLEQKITDGETQLKATQGSNTNATSSFNNSQRNLKSAQEMSDVANAASKQAGEQTAAALKSVDKAQQLISSVKEQATDLAEQAARLRAAGNTTEASAKEAQVASLLQSIANASPELTKAKEISTDSAEATNKARSLAKDADAAQRDANHYWGLASQAQSVAQFASNVASMAQKDLNNSSAKLNTAENKSAEYSKYLADAQVGMAELTRALASTNNQGTKDQLQSKIDDLNSRITTVISEKAKNDAEVPKYQTEVKNASDTLVSTQARAADAERNAADAQARAAAAATDAATAAADARSAAQDATAKAAEAHSKASEAITSLGGTVEAMPAPGAVPAPRSNPTEVNANNKSPAAQPVLNTPLEPELPQLGLQPPPPGSSKQVMASYQDLVDRQDKIKSMQDQAGALLSMAQDPDLTQAEKDKLTDQANRIEVLASQQQRLMLSETTKFRLDDAAKAAKEQSIADGSWLHDYQAWTSVEAYHRLAHESDTREEEQRQALQYAWLKKQMIEDQESQRKEQAKKAHAQQEELEKGAYIGLSP